MLQPDGQANQLRRYLAPQIADAVLSGSATVALTSTRRNLSILFANIQTPGWVFAIQGPFRKQR